MKSMKEFFTPNLDKKNNTDEHAIVEQGYVLNDWFIFREERHFGPLTTKQVRYFLDKKLISADHYIWRPGFTGWTPIHEVEGFRSYAKGQIKYLTDNEFSNKAILTRIDRIASERNEINFIDKTKTAAYELERFTNDRLSKGLPPHLMFSEKLDERLESAGVNPGYAKSILFGALALLFGIGIYSLTKSKTPSAITGLSKGFQNKILAVSTLPESISGGALEIYPQNAKVKDPILVGGTNLPLGSRVLIEVTGKPETLLGSYRFSKKIEMNIESKVFKTDAIRESSGKFIPAGVYTVTGTCLDCAVETKAMFAQEYTFGVSDTALYKTELAKFHTQARRSAKLELQELGDLSSNLSDQFNKSLKKYRSVLRSKNFYRWDNFSATWLLNQRKLIDLFEQMESAEFQDKLFYLSMYQAYNNIIKDIFEVHMVQTSIVEGGGSSKADILEEGQSSEQIKIRLAYLKSQLDLMNVNYSKTTGMPVRTNLNL